MCLKQISRYHRLQIPKQSNFVMQKSNTRGRIMIRNKSSHNLFQPRGTHRVSVYDMFHTSNQCSRRCNIKYPKKFKIITTKVHKQAMNQEQSRKKRISVVLQYLKPVIRKCNCQKTTLRSMVEIDFIDHSNFHRLTNSEHANYILYSSITICKNINDKYIEIK